MVITPKQTTIAYRCPSCGHGVYSAVGIIALKADMLKLKCPCGGSEMRIIYRRDGKVQLTVPCLVCPKPHIFTVSEKLFFERDLFLLPCAYTDIDIGFLGETNLVKAELARTELRLLDMMEEHGVMSFNSLHRAARHALDDPQVLDIVKFVVDDLRQEGKILCRCEDGKGDCDVEILDDSVKVSCRQCGASRVIMTDSYLGAQAFLDCDVLYLE